MRNGVRPVHIVKNYVKHAEGSCLITTGKTKVLCVASVDTRRPPHAEDRNIGWVTAEYAMLPRAGNVRTPRGRASGGGRSQEISRLIGRSFRAAVDLEKLVPFSIIVDCDVIQADGGTRTAAINGGMVALALALKKCRREGMIQEWPLKEIVGAVSVGIVDGQPILDLDYEKDHKADCDFNFVMTSRGRFVEIQGTAEHEPFSEKEFQTLLKLAKTGIRSILKKTRKAIGRLP